MKRQALGVALIAAIAVPAASIASRATTAPTKQVTIVVVLNDKGAKVDPYVQIAPPEGGHGTDSRQGEKLQVLSGPIPRGDYLKFNIYNFGKRAHGFTVFGKKTAPIKPGGKARLFATALQRGKFPYASTTDSAKSYRGSLVVY